MASIQLRVARNELPWVKVPNCSSILKGLKQIRFWLARGINRHSPTCVSITFNRRGLGFFSRRHVVEGNERGLAERNAGQGQRLLETSGLVRLQLAPVLSHLVGFQKPVQLHATQDRT